MRMHLVADSKDQNRFGDGRYRGFGDFGKHGDGRGHPDQTPPWELEVPTTVPPPRWAKGDGVGDGSWSYVMAHQTLIFNPDAADLAATLVNLSLKVSS